MRNSNIYLKEYCQRLSEENLKLLATKLEQRIGADMAEAVDFLSNVKEIDRWLASANSSEEFFDMVDEVQISIEKEYERRCAA